MSSDELFIRLGIAEGRQYLSYAKTKKTKRKKDWKRKDTEHSRIVGQP